MAQLVIPNSCIIKIRWQMGGRLWLNVLGGQGNPVLPTIDATLAEALFVDTKTALTSSGLGALLGTSVALDSLFIRDISAANRFEFKSTGAGQVGTGTGDPLPLNVAACVTLRTTGAGKSFRGRTYFSGFTEAQNDPGGRQAAAVGTAVVAFVNAINTAYKARAIALAVLSHPRDAVTIPEKIIPGKPGFGTAVSVVEHRNTKWESQRRRTGRT